MCSTARPGNVATLTAAEVAVEATESLSERPRPESSLSDVSVTSVTSLQPRIQSTDMERLREDEEGQARDRWKKHHLLL